MEEKTRSIAFLCPVCRQSVIAERTTFQIAAGPMKVPCPCGHSAVHIDMEGVNCILTVPCAVCRKDHHVSCSAHAFLHEKTLGFSCSASGLDCCYVGEEDAVFAAMSRLEDAMNQFESTALGQGAFLNEIVMHEVLSEVKDIMARDGVKCECGEKTQSVSINFSSVDITCKTCGAAMRIPAATASDVEDICCKNTLVLHKKR
jgi:hypothetical protein